MMVRMRRQLSEQLLEAVVSLPRKGNKYGFFIVGDDDGNWSLDTRFDFGAAKAGKWWASASLSSKNDWRTLSVDNATEHHRGFIRALGDVVRKYPELMDWVISFDGPYIPVAKLVGGSVSSGASGAVDWSRMVFYHGTSEWAWQQIKREGLRSRQATMVDAAYGAGVGAKQGRKDAIYLTTQMGMASVAARDAARNASKKGHGGGAVILSVRGLDSRHVEPDEDSGEQDPRRSLEKIGSIAYTTSIPPQKISVLKTL